MPNYFISEKPDSQYALYSLIFSQLRSVINREQHESIPTITPTITENIWNARLLNRASFINFKVGVSLSHGFVSILVVLDSVPNNLKRPCWLSTYRTRGNIDIKATLTNLTKQTIRQMRIKHLSPFCGPKVRNSRIEIHLVGA